jgi:hypothetical protein
VLGEKYNYEWEYKKQLRMSRNRRREDIKTHINEMGFKNTDWISLAQDWD